MRGKQDERGVDKRHVPEQHRKCLAQDELIYEAVVIGAVDDVGGDES